MNMKHYDNLKTVPKTALKEIGFGKLKGKSDINPQWRYEAMTQEFGACGIGWKYEISNTWTQPMEDGQIMVFVQVNVYIKDNNPIIAEKEWGAGIPAIGGDFLLQKDKNGLHGNDEAYKMATTDALGVALKMLGVAADVYRGLANDSKYGREPIQTPAQPIKSAPQAAQGAINLISAEQRKELGAVAKEQNLTGDMLDIIKWKYGKESSKELTELQAKYMIENLSTLWESFVEARCKSA
jgi:hypothetical protein